ncbi:ankyrin repeat-containing domain protein [Lasiosphaeria miniovina]|uniref:Ankyrin repeat-containing domain protein n=1 Tax=Lasiosphaeria miniovina TaxID=1954250 RepID=A0AA40A6P1_9PEZI|nr:ankyrin repeat-containing domain protein [Lasiosphaeria miniovina]KAK0710146.1 ankyrin repeat-containing domain protein [Lasiosphaeria miniovina]
MGWKPLAGQSKPKQSDCREVLKANRSLPRPTPSIRIHSSNCRCNELEEEQRVADELLAKKIRAASEVRRSRRKTTISILLPGQKLERRQTQKQSTITLSMQKRMSRIFASIPTPSVAAVADLCAACSELDITRILRYLSEEEIPVNIHNSVGTTPLMAAVRAADPHLRPTAHLALMTLLLDLGANPNATTGEHTPSGSTPTSVLTAASALDLPEVVKLLLDRGAAVDAPLPAVLRSRLGSRGLRALHVATLADKPESVEILLSYGDANVGSTVDARRSVHRGPDTSSHDTLSRKQPHRRRRDPGDDGDHWTTGITALHLAHDSAACTATLLRHGANPLARDGYGRTPLHWAVEAGNADVVELLLDAGTSADARDEASATPLAMLVARLESGNGAAAAFATNNNISPTSSPRRRDAEIARSLLASGADPDLKHPATRRSTLRDRVLRLEKKSRRVYEPIFEEYETELKVLY